MDTLVIDEQQILLTFYFFMFFLYLYSVFVFLSVFVFASVIVFVFRCVLVDNEHRADTAVIDEQQILLTLYFARSADTVTALVRPDHC